MTVRPAPSRRMNSRFSVTVGRTAVGQDHDGLGGVGSGHHQEVLGGRLGALCLSIRTASG